MHLRSLTPSQFTAAIYYHHCREHLKHNSPVTIKQDWTQHNLMNFISSNERKILTESGKEWKEENTNLNFEEVSESMKHTDSQTSKTDLGWKQARVREGSIGSLGLAGGFPGGTVLKNKPANAGDARDGFDPWVRKTTWGRKWQLIPVFLLGKFHGQSSLLAQSQARAEHTHIHKCMLL